jgi:hypothetical protein
VAFIVDCQAIDRIFDHLMPTFGADGSPPAHVFGQAALAAVEESEEYY